MSRSPAIRSTDLDRVLKALAKNAVPMRGVVVRPGGEVYIDLTTDAAAEQVADDLDVWRSKKRGDRAA